MNIADLKLVRVKMVSSSKFYTLNGVIFRPGDILILTEGTRGLFEEDTTGYNFAVLFSKGNKWFPPCWQLQHRETDVPAPPERFCCPDFREECFDGYW